jgi:transposase InsO family protein
MIDQMKGDYPVRQLCAVLDCPPSTYYYPSQAKPDDPLITAIEDILMRWPFYGYRRVLKQMQRQGWLVGETRVRRVLKEMGHTVKVGRVRVRTTDSSHAHWRYPNLLKHITPKSPDHVWVADITYLRLGWRFIYLAVILDAYTRAVRGWALGRTIDEDLTLAALEMALNHRTPRLFHSDQGAQYTAWRHTQLLLALGVQISMSDTGQPTQNGLAERFIGILKQEHVDYAEYDDFDDAFRQLKHWLEVEYMTERIHSALDYLTPAEFEAAALGQPPPLF